MSAAYDLCDHKLLIQKCRLLNMGKNAVTFISHFLKGRSQYVELGGKESSTRKTGPKGVIQGGKSSGVLFLYYLNDLPAQLTTKIDTKDKGNSGGKEFLDDTTILARAATHEILLKQLNFDFLKIKQYLINPKMAINSSKTQLMVLYPPKQKTELKITLESTTIKHQDEMKILGINLTSNMSFDNHIWKCKKSMINAINAKIAIIKTVKPFLTNKALNQVGANMVNSTILYAAPLWGTTTSSNIAKLQASQIKAARAINIKAWQRTKIKTHRQILLTTINWPNTKQIIESATLNILKKAINGKSSTDLNKAFIISQPPNQRSGPAIRVNHRGKINKTNNTFTVQAPMLFNRLPIELRNPILTTEKFKKQKKTHILKTNHLTMHR